MAIVEINVQPSERELRWFGPILAFIFGVIGAAVFWQFDSLPAARVLWAVGLGLGLLCLAVRPIRLPLYLVWMHAVAPIGWTLSHLVLATVFYLIITPIAVVMRVFGRDKLERRFDESLETYWIENGPDSDAARYFRQS